MNATTAPHQDYRAKPARPSDDELRRLYVTEGKGCPEIGRMLQRDPTTIRLWLIAAGVAMRPRGSDPAQHFKPGHKMRLGIPHTEEAKRKVGAASRARGAVPYLRNGKHYLKGAPPEANPRYLGGATPERQAFYRSPEWRTACRAVWARADAKCERCGLDHRTVDRRKTSFHVHHIVSFQVRHLRAEPANLVLLCAPCHRWVHSKANVGGELLGKGIQL